MIKLDIINEVVNRTGITKTKAELAVETVFESMKKALSTGDRIELRGFGVFNVRPRKTGIGRTPAPARKFQSPRAKPSVSNRVRNSSPSTDFRCGFAGKTTNGSLIPASQPPPLPSSLISNGPLRVRSRQAQHRMSEPQSPVSTALDWDQQPLPTVWIISPPRQRWWLYVLFLFLTLFSTMVVGARMQFYFRNSSQSLL